MLPKWNLRQATLWWQKTPLTIPPTIATGVNISLYARQTGQEKFPIESILGKSLREDVPILRNFFTSILKFEIRRANIWRF